MVKALLRVCVAILPAPQHPTLNYPGLHLRWRLGWLKGWMIRPYWKLRRMFGGPLIRVGRRFSLQGRLRCSGPGIVILGDDVIVDALTTPFTHHQNATIRVGSRTYLNGTRFGCCTLIEVETDCLLADCSLMDTDFHAVHKRRNEPGMCSVSLPIHVGRNVWIASRAAVLKGVSIGEHSVVAYGSVVVKSVADGRIVGGVPAKDLGAVPDGPEDSESLIHASEVDDQPIAE